MKIQTSIVQEEINTEEDIELEIVKNFYRARKELEEIESKDINAEIKIEIEEMIKDRKSVV